MNHAVLGAGAVGGLVGGLLASSGEVVEFIVRPDSVDTYPRRVSVRTPSDEFIGSIEAVSKLTHQVDFLWIATKATQLEQALGAITVGVAPAANVVPLLNGVDHIARLRTLFGKAVTPATIFVESEKVAPGRIEQKSPVPKMSIAGSGEKLEVLATLLRQRGCECRLVSDEVTMLWQKLCFLTPFALTTSAADKTCGEILADPKWSESLLKVIKETCAVAVAEGALVSEEAVVATFRAAPYVMRSSMQKDVAAGRTPELDAIAGPIIREAGKHNISSTTCENLVGIVEGKLGIKSSISSATARQDPEMRSRTA
ncbi:MAG: ketopantoate reductase family protein [Terriglobales bacterium]